MERNAIKRNIDAYVEQNREEIITLLQSLVRIPSLTATLEQEECQEIMAKEFEKAGAQVDRWIPDWGQVENTLNPKTGLSLYQPIEGHTPEYLSVREKVSVVAGTIDTGRPGKTLLLNGHIDVVSAEPLDQWTRDPWGGEIDDGKMYGRGVSDQKGGVVSMLFGAKAALSCVPDLCGKIIMTATPEEENGGNGAAAVVARGYRGDGGILTDGFENQIIRSCIGMQRYRIDIEGKPIFMGEATKGVNAVDLMIDVIQSLRAWEAERNQEARAIYGFGPEITAATINTGYVRAGEWHATIPGHAVVEGLMGILAHEDVNEFRRGFEQRVRTAVAGEWFASHPPKITYYGAKEGCITDENEDIIRYAEQAMCMVRGKEAKAVHTPGCTDMHFFTNTGTPSIVMGPGFNAHCSDEYINIQALLDNIKTIALTIALFCRGE